MAGTRNSICFVFLARSSILHVKDECVLCSTALQDAAKYCDWPHRWEAEARTSRSCTPGGRQAPGAASRAALEAAAAEAEAAAQAEQAQADVEVGAWLDGVLARLEPLSVRLPPAPEQHEFLGLGKTEEEAVAALTSKNNLCTCGQGVPSFLCRVRKCWAYEIGMCEPEVRPNYLSGGFCAIGCKCIQWDRITESGKRLKDEGDDSEGLFTCRFEVVSGEQDEVRRKVFYQGDPETAVRIWPPRRVQFCEGCCCHFGSYVRTCDRDNTQCRRAGRSVMVVSEGGDLAVTCVIRCGGGLRKRCRMSTNASGHCNLYDLPDRVIDRATEAADRERAHELWNKIGNILFRSS